MGFNMMSGCWLSVLPLALAAVPHAASAQSEIRLDRQMFVERVQTDINGRARRVLASADRIDPGDQLIFVLKWRNDGSRPVRGLALTNPVPRRAMLAQTGPSMQVSVDGGSRWGRLQDMWLPTPLGGVRRAVASDVTHVRLTISEEVSPGESGRFSYRATVH